MPDDYLSTTQTTGAVAVGGSATGEIETSKDFDWFAVDLVAGHTYVIDLEGADSGGGALQDPVLRGLYDADGNRIAGARDNDGGVGRDARLTFTAATTGAYYIEARGHSNQTGEYTVRVTEWVDTDAERGGAVDLGDITAVETQFPAASLDGSSDSVDYWRFTLSEARRVGLGLRRQDANADLFLEDAEGNVLYSGTEEGTANEWISQTLPAGTYFVRVEAQEEGANEFKLRYGVSAANPDVVAALEQQQQGTDEAPEFAQPSYAFDLAENADGGAIGVALGAVSATDPEKSTITYSIEAGDSGGLFAIDSETGALSYQGAGEDYESGTTSYELTVRASDGGLHSDVTVTVNVTDVAEAPAFAEASYAFSLAENADGGANGVSLGAVSATDPEDAAVSYSIEGGDSGGLFAIDSETGALSYQGAGEDYESGTTSYELTVRASDGSLHSDVTVTVNVTDVAEAPAFADGSYAFSLAENADGGAIGVALGAVSATDPEDAAVSYSIEAGDSGGLFAIDSETGALSYEGAGEDYESGTTSYELTVRASDGGLHSDVTVTVNVTDVAEAPEFAEASYAFSLAENADGGTDRVSLGAVTATDPDNDTVAYSIEGGNESGSFEIDAASGELFYVGAGEDYEAGAAQFDLTIRASDGALTADAAVSVAITDVPEQTIVAPADPENLQNVSEPYGEDLPTNTSTIGRVAVGGTATGKIGSTGDRDGFAVELVAGRTYIIDLRGSPTGDGTLDDPYLRGIKGPDGRRIAGVSNDDGGEGYNSQLNFTPTESGTHYIIAGAYSGLGAYEVEVRDVSPQTAQQETVNGPPAFGQTSYAFSLAENADGGANGVSLGAVSATDPEDAAVSYSIEAGDSGGLFAIDSGTGALSYQGAGEDYESGTTSYELTVRASDGGLHSDVTVTVNVTDVAEAPAFGQTSYAFSLAENADGGASQCSVGRGLCDGSGKLDDYLQHRGGRLRWPVRDRLRDGRPVVPGRGRGLRVGDDPVRTDGAGE